MDNSQFNVTDLRLSSQVIPILKITEGFGLKDEYRMNDFIR
jgi:hypothetical protein